MSSSGNFGLEASGAPMAPMPNSPSGATRTRPPELSINALQAAMRRVETLPPLAAGTLLVGDPAQPDGLIFVERRRVCWIAGSGLHRRLTEILRSHSDLPLGEQDLEEVYTRCRREQRPLGETLVLEGLISADRLRSAMKEHTVESIIALGVARSARGEREWPLTWVERQHQGYSARYTFTGGELVAAVGARVLEPTSAELISDHLEGLTKVGCSTIGFFADAEPFLTAVHSSLWLSIDDLLELARWATAALDASPGFSPVVANACAQSADGGAVAWIYEGLHCAALAISGATLRRLLNKLENEMLPLVLATKLPVLERVRDRAATPAK